MGSGGGSQILEKRVATPCFRPHASTREMDREGFPPRGAEVMMRVCRPAALPCPVLSGVKRSQCPELELPSHMAGGKQPLSHCSLAQPPRPQERPMTVSFLSFPRGRAAPGRGPQAVLSFLRVKRRPHACTSWGVSTSPSVSVRYFYSRASSTLILWRSDPVGWTGRQLDHQQGRVCG